MTLKFSLALYVVRDRVSNSAMVLLCVTLKILLNSDLFIMTHKRVQLWGYRQEIRIVLISLTSHSWAKTSYYILNEKFARIQV